MNTASRASGALRSEPDFPKAACIVTSRRSIAETATRSRRCGKRRQAAHWLIRLVVATLFMFGLKRGVGAETISEFFGRLHLEAHVGCSPSALRSVMHTLERIILDTAAAWEQEGIAHGEIRPIIGAVDETFLQRMMLVFMDLASGYLLMEEVAVDRTYDTWYGLHQRAPQDVWHRRCRTW